MTVPCQQRQTSHLRQCTRTAPAVRHASSSKPKAKQPSSRNPGYLQSGSSAGCCCVPSCRQQLWQKP
jgi:hypothetical protein